jgi:glutamyl-tRNA synthetase
MGVTVRFAPSPTGWLHVGNARLALVNWLFARRHGGRFVLRLDDTDAARSQDIYVEAIHRDLAWLGLDWDAERRQSDHLAAYDDAAAQLVAAGRLYPCFETPEELEYARRRAQRDGKPPVYDRAALNLSEDEKRALEAEGRRPHWRFRLDTQVERWDDVVRGDSHVDLGSISDPVLRRSDGTWLYTLPSVVDDVDCGVSHVIRGEDHVTNTAAQIQIFRALGAEPPAFAHLPLLIGEGGQPLSKRFAALSLGELHQEGIEAMALAAMLAALGSGHDPRVAHEPQDLLEDFDLAGYGRSAAQFSHEALARHNARTLHAMPFWSAEPRLAHIGLETLDEAFWEAVRPNLEKFGDVAEWWRICREPLAPEIAAEDREFCAEAAGLLPPAPWDEHSFDAWKRAVQQATERKGRALFMPLRLALTGMDHGPELKNLLPLLAPETVAARLRGETA